MCCKCVVIMYVIGISEVSRNGKRSTKKPKKRYTLVYGYDTNGHFLSKRIPKWKKPYYQTQILKRISFFCDVCKKKMNLPKKLVADIGCPTCGF